MNYKEVYDRICSKAKSENRVKGKGVYYEAHHIIPKSHGGDGLVSQYKWHPNVVLLTAKEHFLAHRLLCRVFPKSLSLRKAWWAMCNQKAPNQERIYKPSARAFEEARIGFVESHTGENHPLYGKGYLQAGEKNPAFGKPQSSELRERKRISSTKTWENPELRAAQSLRSKGRKHSQETLEKMKQPKSKEHGRKIGLALKGKKLNEERLIKNNFVNNPPSKMIYECTKCGEKIGGLGNFRTHQKAHDKIVEIENLVNKYFFVSEFKKNHPQLHKFIVNNQLQKKYFSDLQNDAKAILLDTNSGVFYFGYEEAVSLCSLTISPYNLMKMTNNYKDNTTSLIKV
jgi:hypothetical protein